MEDEYPREPVPLLKMVVEKLSGLSDPPFVDMEVKI
jgi:hypothetical protein